MICELSAWSGGNKSLALVVPRTCGARPASSWRDANCFSASRFCVLWRRAFNSSSTSEMPFQAKFSSNSHPIFAASSKDSVQVGQPVPDPCQNFISLQVRTSFPAGEMICKLCFSRSGLHARQPQFEEDCPPQFEVSGHSPSSLRN